MKASVFFLAVFLFASAQAFHSFTYSSEYDLIEDLKDHDDKIYLLFLYASKPLNDQGYESVSHNAGAHQTLKERTDDEHDSVKSYADSNSEVFYSEFDLVDSQHDSVLQELGVVKSDVFSWPITVVVQNGKGYQVTGPNSIYFVKRIVSDLTATGASDVKLGTHMPDGFEETNVPSQTEAPRGQVEPVAPNQPEGPRGEVAPQQTNQPEANIAAEVRINPESYTAENAPIDPRAAPLPPTPRAPAGPIRPVAPVAPGTQVIAP